MYTESLSDLFQMIFFFLFLPYTIRLIFELQYKFTNHVFIREVVILAVKLKQVQQIEPEMIH